MRVLLDTHTLLWATLSPAYLSRTASALLESEKTIVVVSAVCAWEIATKVRLGKLDIAGELEQNFLRLMREAGYTLLPLSVEDGLRAGRLSGSHGDPFDRMLAAQALTEDMPIISKDPKLDSFGVRRIW